MIALQNTARISVSLGSALDRSARRAVNLCWHQRSTEKGDCAAEDSETRAEMSIVVFRVGIGHAIGRVRGEDVSLGVGHHAEHSTSAVDEGSRVFNTAIGVFRENRRLAVASDVAQGDVSEGGDLGRAGFAIFENDLAFAMCDREPEGLAAFQKRTVVGVSADGDPAVFVTAGVVEHERRTCRTVCAGKHAHAHENLEAVADAEQKSAAIDEGAERVAEMVRELAAEDFPTGDVVAVTEAAGDGEDLIIVEEARIFNETVDVDALGQRTGHAPRVRGFFVAVDAGGAEDESVNSRHEGSVSEMGKSEKRNGSPCAIKGWSQSEFFDLRAGRLDNLIRRRAPTAMSV